MGLYDHVRIEDGLKIDLPEFNGDPTDVDWQTKTFRQPRMDVYTITMDRRLFKEEAHYESVPETERPKYDDELDGFEKEWHEGVGSLRKIQDGWTDTDYHGILEFHHHIDGESYAYEAKFTDGDLVTIERVERG